VPEVTAFCVDLVASRRAGRLFAAARLLTGAALVATIWASVRLPTMPRLLAALAAIGASALAFRPRQAAARTLAVGADGAIRSGPGESAETAAVRYAGRHFICLETAGGLIGVWPDSLSPDHWRRLSVACRWQHRPPADGTQASSGLRTK
jgi:hypothetical protein